jgi:hypothetical protein
VAVVASAAVSVAVVEASEEVLVDAEDLEEAVVATEDTAAAAEVMAVVEVVEASTVERALLTQNQTLSRTSRLLALSLVRPSMSAM